MLETEDFQNIQDLFDFLLANLGILDKSMISVRFPHGEKFLGGNVSGAKSFCRIQISRDLSGFQDF